MPLNKLLNYNTIYNQWVSNGSTKEAAIELTLQQLDALEEIVNNDISWHELLKISANGRNQDAWLAMDWPEGFDELLLCVPLCKFIDWECSKCFVGMRQENNSCAFDYSIFGYIGELIKAGSRDELKQHILNTKMFIKNSNYLWNIHKCEIEILKP